ncbi:MAG: LacI family DNA-binding transcriptional regulator [Candidatus Limnocylindria bacterium]
MTATLSDVAQRAGVSEATASRVLNGRRYVADATRARVQAAAQALDYLPNRAARNLSMARTATVALLVHRGQYPAHGEGTFASRVLHGVSQALRLRGYDLLYAPVDDAAVEHLARLSAVRAGRSDGALLLGPAFPAPAVDALVAARWPLVLVDNAHDGVDAVMADNRPAAEALTRHLVDDHGYRRVLCIAGPAHWPSNAERIDGYVAAMDAACLTPQVIHAAETTMRDGAEAVGRLPGGAADAIVAVNDAMAIGALHRLRPRPPRERPAVVGFDDIAWARLTEPPLTTVAVDAEAMGSRAADLLIDRIEAADDDVEPARIARVPATLRLRRSCGCAPVASRDRPFSSVQAVPGPPSSPTPLGVTGGEIPDAN